MSEDAQTFKTTGTEAFKAKDFEKAIEFFKKAIELTPEDHTLYGNTSAAYLNANNPEEALNYSEKCIEVKPDWSKGYQRKGQALVALKKEEEAKEVFNKGLEIDPANTQIKSALQNLDRPKAGEDPFFSAEGMAKLAADPKTSKYLEDPDFKNKLEFCKQNPQMMMQLMQTDQRFADVFRVITGIDLMQMQEQQVQSHKKAEEMRKQKEEEDKKKQEEEEERKKKEAEDALTGEEKEKLEAQRKADAEKDLGNAAYKAKDFAQAIEHYDNAIALCPNDITFYTNKAAVFFQKGEYDTCIDLCDQAIKISQEGYYDFKKLGKAFARKGNALFKLNKHDESIDCYKKAMLEHNDYSFKEAMRKVEKAKKKAEEEAYIDPEKSEEHREAGNKLFKEGNFPAAIKEYDEGLKRDPKNVKIFSNRAFAYVKLMEFPTALKDVEKGLAIDPEFTKLWIRKGNIHMGMKEFHKALEAFDKGLKIDPENQECKNGKQKVMVAISMGASGGGADDQERMQHAMADPEIQGLMKDFRVQSLLQDMQTDPQGAQAKMMGDAFLTEAVNKLIAAGVIKVK